MNLEASRTSRFLKVFFHPGTWVFFGLVAIGLAIAFPPVAISLLIFSAIAMVVAAVCTLVYLLQNQAKIAERRSREDKFGKNPSSFEQFKYWLTNHKVQAVIVALGIIVAITLTVGFIATGGVGFAFMAPLMAALTTTFAPAATAGSVAALAAATAILATLNITNLLKRFAAWLDSFKKDCLAEADNVQDGYAIVGDDWEREVDDAISGLWVESTTSERGKLSAVKEYDFIAGQTQYLTLVFGGIWACVKQGFNSVHEDKIAGYVPGPRG